MSLTDILYKLSQVSVCFYSEVVSYRGQLSADSLQPRPSFRPSVYALADATRKMYMGVWLRDRGSSSGGYRWSERSQPSLAEDPE